MLRPVSARVLSLVLVLVLSLLAEAPARADDWWGSDKAKHLSVSLAMSAGWYTGLTLLGRDPRPQRLILGSGLALLPGLLKEIYDSGRPGNRFSGKDLTWDVVGVVSGGLLALGVELLITRWAARRARQAAPTLAGAAAPLRAFAWTPILAGGDR